MGLNSCFLKQKLSPGTQYKGPEAEESGERILRP